MPDTDLPKGTGWHHQPKTVIPDLIRNLRTLFHDIFMQRVEIPNQVRDDAFFELYYLDNTKFNDLISPRKALPGNSL